MNKAAPIIRISIPAAMAVLFCLWLFRQEEPMSLGTLTAALSAYLFTILLTRALARLAEGSFGAEADPLLPIDTRQERLTAWGALVLFGVAVSLLQFLTVYLLLRPQEGFFASFSSLYYRSDVAHYMGIAQDGYVQEGAERLRLVFLPLYPLFVRALTWNGDYFAGAFAAAQIFSLACLPAAYELFRLDLDRREAMACARLLFLLPGAAFLRVPMSEGLFLLLTLLAVRSARRGRFLTAGLFTALSALTRSLGILLLGLLFLEMLLEFLPAYQKDRQKALGRLPRYLAALGLGCCGTLLYLFLNWRVSGSPFTFLTYQRENWNQQMGLFFNTTAYQAEYALFYLKEGDFASAVSLSLPNLLCAFGALGLLFVDRDRMRISYLLWSLLYFAAAIGATWLLSGPRYLAMVFPLALALRRLCKAPADRPLLEGALLLLQTGYLLMLALDLSVY